MDSLRLAAGEAAPALHKRLHQPAEAPPARQDQRGAGKDGGGAAAVVDEAADQAAQAQADA